MREYLKLFRVKHYIKNILIFIPLFFSGNFFEREKLSRSFLGGICFCLVASAIYILNDLRDVDKDRNHPTKRNRPLASGTIKKSVAIVCSVVCLINAVLLSALLETTSAFICLVLYFFLNVGYSMELKNRPIIDVVILTSGFVIRVFYGGYITGTSISKWLYLVIVAGSLYMGFGKRRNELRIKKDTREVLKYYNETFLDKNMCICAALVDVFYALWTLEMGDNRLIWTVPFFIVILMNYSLKVEGDSDGDPVEVILKDKLLVSMAVVYAIFIFGILYLT